jgi:hypothetical protein
MKEFTSGWTTLETTLAQHFYVPKISSISKTVCKRYNLCAINNPDKGQYVNICWYLSTPSQDRWKPSLLDCESPRSGQVPVKETIPQFEIPVPVGSTMGKPLWLRWYS